ncbi:lysosome membrane protein 2-like isoform X2 [Acanthaster planci]|uniref:Lysosome membrane protein 2-like isoform X2 n=1 Tax=Acanthaster planci TaxID=133434 RepID=A0A8B7XFF8_ACAPL|nr:lysosome membrane protein 2-like isoform X2 [Acanthaster planci]
MAVTTKVCSVVLVLGVIVAIIGGVMFPVFQKIIHDEIVKQTMLKMGTMGYDIWKNPTADVYMQFWVWNLTNPIEVQNGKEPFLVERGPYTYREIMVKENISSNRNGTITYAQEKSYVLDLDMSVGDPQKDKFTTINIPVMTVAGMLPHLDLGPFEKAVLEGIIRGSTTFPSHTVWDMIWGYDDELMKLAHLKHLAPYDRFGFFVNRNNSNDGLYTVYSGVDKSDTSRINHITRWKGQSELPFWSTPEANTINGTDGSYNQPFFDKRKLMYVFSSDICRSISAVYEKETEVRDISTWRYVGPPEAFANATENPDNAGFCTPNTTFCLPSGLLNVSNCQFGAPIVMSLPHFLYCDRDKVIDLVHGVEPQKEVHQTFFDIEPMTGGPLNIAKRLQINVYMQPFEKFDKLKNLRKLFLPVVWLNESGLLTESGADQLKSQVETPVMLTVIAEYATLGLGLLIVILAVVVLTVTWIYRPVRQLPYSSTSPEVHAGRYPGNSSVVPVNPNGPVVRNVNESSPLLG